MSGREYFYSDHPVGRDAVLAGYAPIARTRARRPRHAERQACAKQLRTFDLFRDCSEQDLGALVRVAQTFTFPASWAIAIQDTPSDACYAITEGRARIYRDRCPIAEIGPGTVVGTFEAFTGTLRSTTVTTLTHVAGLRLSNVELAFLFRRRPTLYHALLGHFVERAAAADWPCDPAPLPKPRPPWARLAPASATLWGR